ncbi:16S rRNA (cytosine967-C5)-methyltransferase [Gammaproteobacteria bacterium]
MNPRPLLVISAELLCAVLDDACGANRYLLRYFQEHPQFGSHDRRVLADVVYGCLRRLRSLGHTLGQPERPDWHLTAVEARVRVAAWMLTTDMFSRKEIDDALGGEVEFLDIKRGNDPPPAVAADLPDWLYDELIAVLGTTETRALAQALLQPAPLDLRVNTQRTSRAKVARQLHDAGIAATPTPFSPVGLRLSARISIIENPLYRHGLVEIQDEGSQLIALLLAPRRNEIIVDFCAGAGGKTLHLGALMANTGALYAFDPATRRLDELRVRVERAGLTTVRITRIDDLVAAPILALRGKVDRVLVDAPCTGSGTLRRAPDIKWHYHDLDRLATEQRRILATAASLLRPGGHLVYATCSLSPTENDAVVADFLFSHPDFIPVPPHSLSTRLNIPVTFSNLHEMPALRLYPHHHGTDGFFAMLMKKSDLHVFQK